MSSKARRPYLMGKQSLTTFYSSPARYLKEITGKESEFEKPYEDEDYRKMHFDFPWPDWPPFPDFPPLPPFPGLPEPGLEGCAIVCYDPQNCDDPIWCHPGIWCGYDPGCSLCSWSVEGAVLGFTPHPFGGSKHSTWGIDIWIDKGLVQAGGEALVKVCMKDPCRNICCYETEITCKKCPPDISISWDDASDDTIAAGNGGLATATVIVKDGLGPYSWSVSGTGFSMLNASTDGVINTLQADASACGMATITVTDDCGESVIGRVRCTTGIWCEIALTECTITGAITEGDNKTRIQEQYKMEEVWATYASCGGASCDCDFIGGDACSESASCHATLGCTQCLTHSNGYCGTGVSEDTPCGSGGGYFCCCEDATCDYYCSHFCNRATSKLYEWKCAC